MPRGRSAPAWRVGPPLPRWHGCRGRHRHPHRCRCCCCPEKVPAWHLLGPAQPRCCPAPSHHPPARLQPQRCRCVLRPDPLAAAWPTVPAPPLSGCPASLSGAARVAEPQVAKSHLSAAPGSHRPARQGHADCQDRVCPKRPVRTGASSRLAFKNTKQRVASPWLLRTAAGQGPRAMRPRQEARGAIPPQAVQPPQKTRQRQ